MKKIKKYSGFVFYLFFLLILFLVFKNWFLLPQIIGGDWPYYFKEGLERYSSLPTIWTGIHGNGLGGEIPFYPLDFYSYLLVSVFVNLLNISWVVVYKVFYFGLFIALSLASSFYLSRLLIPSKDYFEAIASSLIYTTNTYILLIVGGGQMGVALSYAVFPLVIASFIRIFRKEIPKIYDSILCGIVLSILFFFDARFGYLALIIFAGYFLYKSLFLKNSRQIASYFIFGVTIPIALSLLINSFWLLRVFSLEPGSAVQYVQSISNEGFFKFLSFGQFPQSLSILHPNFPENIFGKTYFMKSEFILIPLLAFGFLLNRTIKFRREILFFAFLGLGGAFLAKGMNDPLGQINLFLYNNIPGFSMFRDPLKFYTFTALSFSILIPYTISILSERMKNKIPLFIGFLLLWVFLIRVPILGELGGTFAFHEVPKDYQVFKDLIKSDEEFSRTFWIPRQHRFSYLSHNHPSVEADPLFKTGDLREIINILNKPETKVVLGELSVRYLVVPNDSLSELFLEDRKYDDTKYQYLVSELDKISYLKRLNGFEKLAVYEIGARKDKFWIDSGEVSYQMINPVYYKIQVKNSKPGSKLVFSENYSRNWILSNELRSDPYNNHLNSFTLEKGGDYDLILSYSLQKYLYLGGIISVVALLSSVSLLLFGFKAKRW